MSKFKKTLSLVVVLVLTLSFLTSCSLTTLLSPSMHVDRGPYKSFTLMNQDMPRIDKPVQTWTYHWPEKYSEILEADSKLVVDNDGNIYFVGANWYLYSIDTNGELRWKKNNYRESIAITQEGIIVSKMGGIELINFEGKSIWTRYFIFPPDEFYLTPGGNIIVYVFNHFVCLDSKGKTQWNVPVGDGLLLSGFFDENSNGYFAFFQTDYEKEPIEKDCTYYFKYYILSISSDGQVRWENIIAEDRNFIDEFKPKDDVVKDTYLLAFSTSKLGKQEDGMYNDQRVQPKIVRAYNTNGEEIWQFTQEKVGRYEDRYSIDTNNNFYICFNEVGLGEPDPEKDQEILPGNLTCVNKEGNVVWNKKSQNAFVVCPTFDSENNSYIGFITRDYKEGMYSFYPNGEERWKLDKIEVACGFKYNLVLSPKKKIHFTSWSQSLIFCLDDSSE